VIFCIGNDWRRKIPDKHNRFQTKEVDRTHTLRGESLLKTVINRKKLGKRWRGTPRQNNAGLDVGGRLQEAELRS